MYTRTASNIGSTNLSGKAMRCNMQKSIYAILLILAGCSDPQSDRLKPGDTGVVIDSERENVLFSMPDSGNRLIRQGTAIVVISDESRVGISDSPNRPVKVTLKDGEAQGASGLVVRRLIVPK